MIDNAARNINVLRVRFTCACVWRVAARSAKRTK